MQNTNANANEGIDTRDARAACESMSLDPLAGEAGEFDVYSESGSVYRVDVVTGDCECPSAEYQSGACKHLRRVEMETGQRDVPELDKETDVEMMIDAHAKRTSTKEIVTDGGVATENPTQNREPAITRHVEPLDQGGATYFRCENCGWESLRRADLEGDEHAGDCEGRR